MNVTAIVLSGGKSRRLGRTKALETVGGKPILQRVIGRLEPLAGQILVVTSRSQMDLPVSGGAEILPDHYPDKGPLGGICTGLMSARFPYSLVVACDMPFLNTELLAYMVTLSNGVDAVVPRLGESMVEPLHAVYSSSALGAIKTEVESNRLTVYSILDKLRVRYVERDECERFDPQLLSFFNVNRQPDLDSAALLAASLDQQRC